MASAGPLGWGGPAHRQRPRRTPCSRCTCEDPQHARGVLGAERVAELRREPGRTNSGEPRPQHDKPLCGEPPPHRVNLGVAADASRGERRQREGAVHASLYPRIVPRARRPRPRRRTQESLRLSLSCGTEIASIFYSLLEASGAVGDGNRTLERRGRVVSRHLGPRVDFQSPLRPGGRSPIGSVRASAPASSQEPLRVRKLATLAALAPRRRGGADAPQSAPTELRMSGSTSGRAGSGVRAAPRRSAFPSFNGPPIFGGEIAPLPVDSTKHFGGTARPTARAVAVPTRAVSTTRGAARSTVRSPHSPTCSTTRASSR